MSDQGEDDVIDVLKNHLGSDHTRGCEGRCYSCTCGYDISTETILVRAADEIASLRDQLEEQKSGWANCFKLAVHHQDRADAAEAQLASARMALREMVDQFGPSEGDLCNCSTCRIIRRARAELSLTDEEGKS